MFLMRIYHHSALVIPGSPGLARREGRGREIEFVRPGLRQVHQVCVPECAVIPEMMKTHCGAGTQEIRFKTGPLRVQAYVGSW